MIFPYTKLFAILHVCMYYVNTEQPAAQFCHRYSLLLIICTLVQQFYAYSISILHRKQHMHKASRKMNGARKKEKKQRKKKIHIKSIFTFILFEQQYNFSTKFTNSQHIQGGVYASLSAPAITYVAKWYVNSLT